MGAHAVRVCHRGVFARGGSQCALRERHRARACLLEGLLHARERPQWGVVAESRPPRRTVLVAAVGGVLHHPRRACRVCRLDELRRERRKRVVFGEIAPPPRRNWLYALRLGPAAQLWRVCDGEGRAGRRGEDRVKLALAHPPQHLLRHLGASEVVVPAADAHVYRGHLRASALELRCKRGPRRSVARERDEDVRPRRLAAARAAAVCAAAAGLRVQRLAAVGVVLQLHVVAVAIAAVPWSGGRVTATMMRRAARGPARTVATVSATDAARAAAPVRSLVRHLGRRAHCRVAGARSWTVVGGAATFPRARVALRPCGFRWRAPPSRARGGVSIHRAPVGRRAAGAGSCVEGPVFPGGDSRLPRRAGGRLAGGGVTAGVSLPARGVASCARGAARGSGRSRGCVAAGGVGGTVVGRRAAGPLLDRSPTQTGGRGGGDPGRRAVVARLPSLSWWLAVACACGWRLGGWWWPRRLLAAP
eukprot:2731715-Pleurochrysis_carterae.AAC.3